MASAAAAAHFVPIGRVVPLFGVVIYQDAIFCPTTRCELSPCLRFATALVRSVRQPSQEARSSKLTTPASRDLDFSLAFWSHVSREVSFELMHEIRGMYINRLNLEL